MKEQSPSDKALVQFTKKIAVEAGEVLLKYFGKAHRVRWKKNAGIVTEADEAAENLLMKNILRAYPSSSIITEESGEHLKGGELSWIMDPLDGTSNYAHHFPWFCVSIAVQREGVTSAGVVYQPVTRELFWAQKGKGSFLGDKRIKVSPCRRMKESLLGTGFYYFKGRGLTREIETFRKMNQLALAVRRPGSAALDLACVASGRYDGFWERGLSSWDVAAGFLLVEEAGGKITNYSGKSTTIFDKEVLASNGLLHRQMVKVIGRK
jgi:myo-inositol-1(or 4)-monophosphatase